MSVRLVGQRCGQALVGESRPAGGDGSHLGLTPNHESFIPGFMERDQWFGQAADIRWHGNLSC
jgi:hypothetical protein